MRSASKSPHSTLRALDGPLLEALSCLREIGYDDAASGYEITMPCGSPDGTHENNQPRAWTAKCGVEPSSEVWPGAREHSCVGTRRGARWRVHVIDSAGEYGPTSRPFPIDVVPRFTPLSREARSTPQARSRVQRVLGRDAAGSSRRRARNRATVGAVSARRRFLLQGTFDRDMDCY